MAVSKTLRFEVFKRDGFACQYCGAKPGPDVLLEADHVIPVSGGGLDELNNLLTSCFSCNRGKGARALADIPEPLLARAAEITEREEQIGQYREAMRAARDRVNDEAMDIGRELGLVDEHDSMNKAQHSSILRFLDSIDYEIVLDLASAARARGLHGKRCFLYFCKSCWNTINGVDHRVR